MSKQVEQVICAATNSSKTVVALGMQAGFRVFSMTKFTEILRVDLEGGVGLIDMFEYSNLFALRSASNKTYEDKNKVILYDGKEKKVIAVLSFEINIRSLRLTKDYLVACGQTRTFLYELDPREITPVVDYWTRGNPEGACDIVLYKKETFLAIPVGIEEFEENGIVAVHNLTTEKDPYLIRAFELNVDRIRFDRDVSRIVAYCHEMLLFRIFEIKTGKLLQSLKRDYSAPLMSIEFTGNNLFLICCDRHSDNEIYNTYGTEKTDKQQLNVNRRSMFSFMSNFIPSFSNEWSFASKRSTESCPGISYFSSESQFCMISFNGQHQKYNFDILYGGDCFLEEKVTDFIQ